MNVIRTVSRRHFLKTSATAAAAAPFISSALIHGAEANSKLNHACIGVGGMMGGNDLQNFKQHPKVEIAAICDVDENHLKKAAELVPNARQYRDWRELLEKEGNRIDSVNVTVPDHMHYPIALRAIQAGKHVYCQKPMCHDVAEVRSLSEAAVKMKVVTQLGTQGASTVTERSAVKMIKEGVIGKIKRVVMCANRPGAIENYRLLGPRPAQGVPPPSTLIWNSWLGCAPERPFASDIYHPVMWRAWQDFGTGWSGDIGCHLFAAPWKALGLQAPKTVIADVQESWQNSPERRADTWPQSQHIVWNFPGNTLTDGELTMEWFDGLMFPPKDIKSLFTLDEYPTESAMFVGTEGAMLLPLMASAYLLPEDKFKKQVRPKFENRNHYHHFADACLGGEKTESNFAFAGPMAETVLLGTVAIRVPGKTLEWDAASMKTPNMPEAEKFLRRKYRPGWVKEG